jgi:hypothetical protein
MTSSSIKFVYILAEWVSRSDIEQGFEVPSGDLERDVKIIMTKQSFQFVPFRKLQSPGSSPE